MALGKQYRYIHFGSCLSPLKGRKLDFPSMWSMRGGNLHCGAGGSTRLSTYELLVQVFDLVEAETGIIFQESTSERLKMHDELHIEYTIC